MGLACDMESTILGDHTPSETITGWEGALLELKPKPVHCCARLVSQVKTHTCQEYHCCSVTGVCCPVPQAHTLTLLCL